MISVEVPATRRSRWQRLWRPKIVAVFSFRYDVHLVPDLLENIRPMVDGWVSWDDRGAAETFSGDTARRQALIEAAHSAGAQWLLAMDPDERLEAGAKERMRFLTHIPGPVCWTFELKELYTPTAYRVDGLWGSKRQKRLFPIFDSQFPIQHRGSFASRLLHDHWVPPSYTSLSSRLNLYHLKMIAPSRRAARSQLYKALDPDCRYQKIGYDYLADDGDAVLEPIPVGRHYYPAHEEDDGLWMADPLRVGRAATSTGHSPVQGSAIPNRSRRRLRSVVAGVRRGR